MMQAAQTDSAAPVIRPAGMQDAEFICRLMNCPPVLHALNEVPTELQDWTDAVGEWLLDDDEEDYIVLLNNTPAGWIGINGLLGRDRTAYIKMAAFLPEYQGRGYGSSVLQSLLQSLKDRGVEKVLLYTDRDNARAQKCYQKCGFRITKSLTETMSNGKEVPRVIMESVLR